MTSSSQLLASPFVAKTDRQTDSSHQARRPDGLSHVLRLALARLRARRALPPRRQASIPNPVRHARAGGQGPERLRLQLRPARPRQLPREPDPVPGLAPDRRLGVPDGRGRAGRRLAGS